MNRRNLMVAALVAVVSWPAVVRAQKVEHGRGDITAIDVNRGEVELKDPQRKVRTWRFERDATVKVSDDSRAFTRNPTTADLRPPMYVHYTYVNDVIQTFDIIEIRAAAGSSTDGRGTSSGSSTGGRGTSSGNSSGQAASPRTVVGRVTAYDPRVRQVEVDHDGKRETFQLTTSSDRRMSPGDRVQIRTEWSGSREQVAEVRVLEHSR